MEWADKYRKLRVRTNADTPADAKQAKNLGAEGIYYISGAVVSLVAIFYSMPSGIHPLVIVILGGVIGALAVGGAGERGAQERGRNLLAAICVWF